MSAWGFAYRSNIVWAKDRLGTGYWTRNKHEHLLIGARGAIPAPAMGRQWPSLIEAPVGAHSAKPEVFLDLVEAYFPTLPKIELNRRGPARPGWDAWGNEGGPRGRSCGGRGGGVTNAHRSFDTPASEAARLRRRKRGSARDARGVQARVPGRRPGLPPRMGPDAPGGPDPGGACVQPDPEHRSAADGGLPVRRLRSGFQHGLHPPLPHPPQACAVRPHYSRPARSRLPDRAVRPRGHAGALSLARGGDPAGVGMNGFVARPVVEALARPALFVKVDP